MSSESGLLRTTMLRIMLTGFCLGLFTIGATSLTGQSIKKKILRQDKLVQEGAGSSENATGKQEKQPDKSPFDELQDPDFGDPDFNNGLTPEEEAAAQGAAGCMTCGCCGFYGAFFFVWIIALFAGVGIQIFLTVFVYNDATKNQVDNPGLWALVTFFLGVIGFLIYFLAARNNRPTQPPHHPPAKPM